MCAPIEKGVLAFIISLVAFSVPPIILGCSRSADTSLLAPSETIQIQSNVLFESAKGPIAFLVEIARTQAERARGLMYRKELGQNSGMLFIFDSDTQHAFWMKNTPLALDIIFIDNTWHIVHVVENMRPFSIATHRPNIPCRYALEINAGLAKKLGLDVGISVKWIEEKK